MHISFSYVFSEVRTCRQCGRQLRSSGFGEQPQKCLKLCSQLVPFCTSWPFVPRSGVAHELRTRTPMVGSWGNGEMARGLPVKPGREMETEFLPKNVYRRSSECFCRSASFFYLSYSINMQLLLFRFCNETLPVAIS